ncbi:chloride channel protein [Bifidobacterium leontopitheci]|uniref:Chloride channel protein n=1 Tax=Bifidobacterium leontopitheci TaxID=2650774 RepID=A0A6I1GKY8_9BIFI|nr:chloride channel protein [Bifidobacterium leontopitheci]KAB7790119.1 chloride channel protein [Bifidobacterium leontopitheci]
MTDTRTDANTRKNARWKRLGWLTVAVLGLGALIGAGAGLLTLLLYRVEELMLGYVESQSVPGPFHVPALRRIISVTAGLSIAGVIWWLLRTKTMKVPSVKKAVAGERMPFWQTIVHVVLQIFIVGSGASIGREVAPRELGAMLAQRFCDLFHLDRVDTRVVVAVAAGAGLGGVYNAPLAGMFFAVEILLAEVTIEKVAFGLGMSAMAAFVAAAIKGHHVFYDITVMQDDSTPTLMLAALLLGALAGVAGAWFRRGAQWAESHKPKGAAILWQMPLAGVLTGIVAVVLPQIMGNGRAAAQIGFSTVSMDEGRSIARLINDRSVLFGSGAGDASTSDGLSPWQSMGLTSRQGELIIVMMVLVLTLLFKAVATLLTIRSGASGGVLQPGIALGSIIGAIFGIFWAMAFPADSVTACALIGAAALLAASQQAPLMAMCLVMELTEAPIGFFVPVGLGVAVSALVSSTLLRKVDAAVER